MPGPGLWFVGDEELHELVEVVRSREMSRYRFDGGDEISRTRQFEEAFSAWHGGLRALGMNSCTSALLSGLWAAGIGPGDEVLVPGYTFIAPLAAVVYAGATPVLVEVDDALSIDARDAEGKVTPRTVAIVAVHMLGRPCDMEPLTALAARHGLRLIEDCAQAAGARYHGRPVGSFGDLAAFSLNVFKTFTAGDGGVLLTRHDDLYERAYAIHDHGSSTLRSNVGGNGPLLGLNLRMHELTGAVALAQFGKLPGILERVRTVRDGLRSRLPALPGAAMCTSHDPAGECGTTVLLRFDDAGHARRSAERLGTHPLSESGKHHYRNMALLHPPAVPRVIAAAHAESRVEAPVLPVTDDLLERTLAIGVGLHDSYLGTGVAAALDAGDADLDELAAAVVHAVAAG